MGQKIDINKYLGSWYEIARIHNEFEPNMYDVAAKYTLKENGDIEVLNSGYINGEFKSITGIAKTTDKDDVLKVSFVPGVESNYKILAIVDNYDYALVGGDDPNWHYWLRSEGFKHITDRTEDSYGFINHYPEFRTNYEIRSEYWYWSKLMGCYIFHIYVFRNSIVIDKDWDCGGNAGGRCFDITLFTMKEIWDEIIDYIKANID